MNYKEALEFIHGTHKFGIKLGLDNMRALLELMGNPHQKLRFVHVAGTNGKGSTVAYLSSVLMEAGYRVGIYTSPYIQRFTERIKVDNTEITEDALARITCTVKEKVAEMLAAGLNHPTEFEIVTAIGFQYFYESKCDIVVLEVGLGGRFDSTNIIESPLVSVITTINYDHMNRLGNTLPEIAYQKAGIIKEHSDVVLYPQLPDVEKVFREVAKEKNAKLNIVSFDSLKLNCAGLDGQAFDFEGYKDLKTSLLGNHQTRNAAVAVKALEILAEKGFSITDDIIRRGICRAKWPGRFEILRKRPVFVIDGAHNGEGAEVLADALRKYFPDRKITFIMGVIKEKDYKPVVEAIVPLAQRVFTVRPNDPRGMDSTELSEFIRNYGVNAAACSSVKEAVDRCISESGDDDIICACGSLYYIGEVRSILGVF